MSKTNVAAAKVSMSNFDHPDYLKQDYFALFGLNAPVFNLDLTQLNQAYRQLQTTYHPDRFTHLTDQEQRLAVQFATHINHAYQTLKHPLARARYVLSLHQIDTQEESNTAMPFDFLEQQFEWREALDLSKQAHDEVQLEQLLERAQLEIARYIQLLGQYLDQQHAYIKAAETVRKLCFIYKLEEEIEQSLS